MGINMELRKYQKEDSSIICGWIKNEQSLYQWSANRIGTFPLTDNALNEDYAPRMKSDRFIPLSALDENGHLAGHLYIRYPNEADDSIVRFRTICQGHNERFTKMPKNSVFSSTPTINIFSYFSCPAYRFLSVG